MTTMNQQILLASRPAGEPTASNFRLVQTPVGEPANGEVLVRHHYLSLDPYMRGRMNEGKSYIEPQALGEVMGGGSVGEVVASRNAGFAVGDKVVGMGGWQEYQLVGASQVATLQKVDTTHIPLAAYLGAVGMPGVTAWQGLTQIIAPKAGETVVVSAASGAVGGAFGQLAKTRGARVVGLAGGPEKCAYVTRELGFDACIDYKLHKDLESLGGALKSACPDGIDGYFENVGGMTLDAVLLHSNTFARIAVCGMISGYNGEPIPMLHPTLILVNRIKLQGFIVTDRLDLWPAALQELGSMVATGKLKYRETVAQGLASAPEAFMGLLKGRNFGKQLVKLV